jgi:hypothetical protein
MWLAMKEEKEQGKGTRKGKKTILRSNGGKKNHHEM